MLSVLRKTGMSPEQLGPVFGLSSMTLRRWEKAGTPSKHVPKMYEPVIIEGVYRLIADGKLNAEDTDVAEILKKSTSASFQAVVKGMGLSAGDLSKTGSQEDKLEEFMSRLGISEEHRHEVNRDKTKINAFKRLGAEWERLISTLGEIVGAKNLLLPEKFIAYGALFYLLCPLDFIPDHIPVFGLLDDFAILSMATAFYTRSGWKSQKTKE